MKVLIVEDETVAVDNLRTILADLPRKLKSPELPKVSPKQYDGWEKTIRRT